MTVHSRQQWIMIGGLHKCIHMCEYPVHAQPTIEYSEVVLCSTMWLRVTTFPSRQLRQFCSRCSLNDIDWNGRQNRFYFRMKRLLGVSQFTVDNNGWWLMGFIHCDACTLVPCAGLEFDPKPGPQLAVRVQARPRPAIIFQARPGPGPQTRI